MCFCPNSVRLNFYLCVSHNKNILNNINRLEKWWQKFANSISTSYTQSWHKTLLHHTMSTKEFTKKSLVCQYLGVSSAQWKRTQKSTSKKNRIEYWRLVASKILWSQLILLKTNGQPWHLLAVKWKSSLSLQHQIKSVKMCETKSSAIRKVYVDTKMYSNLQRKPLWATWLKCNLFYKRWF